MTRRPIAQHAPLRTPTAFGGLLRLLGVGLAVVTVSALAVGGFLAFDILNRVGSDAVALEDAPEVAPPALGPYPGEFAILLTGTDECGEVSKELLGERCRGEEGTLNDVNLVVHVSAEPRKVSVISFPRDLMIPVPECAREDGSTASAMSKQPLNTVFGHAGVSCVAKTLSELSDGALQIGFAAKLSFDGVMEITDDIGGVEICVAGDGIYDSHTGLEWPPGLRTISGYEALQFIRVRHGVGDGSDLSRISNQQQYMSRLAKKVLSSETLTDIPTVMRLANTIADNVVPDQNLADPIRMTQLALALNDVPFEDFVFLQYPTLEDPDDRNKVVPNQAAAEALWDALASDKAIEITGGASNHGGAVETSPEGEPTEEPAPVETGDPAPSDRAELPPEISGINLNQETCSGGRFGT